MALRPVHIFAAPLVVVMTAAKVAARRTIFPTSAYPFRLGSRPVPGRSPPTPGNGCAHSRYALPIYGCNTSGSATRPSTCW